MEGRKVKEERKGRERDRWRGRKVKGGSEQGETTYQLTASRFGM